jgi:hypothetical protein
MTHTSSTAGIYVRKVDMHAYAANMMKAGRVVQASVPMMLDAC